ncbi:hypothetical protein FQN52_004516 [Onygenales sp. PD_12]|nr:hypothetical protein FQN52_004516 [Onygenales sp. PD_12]
MPLYYPESQTANRPDLTMFQALIQPYFPSARVLDYQTPQNTIHSIYHLNLSNGLALTLKANPRQPTTMLRHERYSLETEAEVLSLVAPRQNPYIPRLIGFDTLKSPPKTPYLLKQSVGGVPLSSVAHSLTPSQQNTLDTQLGSTVRLLGQHKSTRFGPVHDVALGAGKLSWRHAFLRSIESLLCDAEDMFITLPYAEIRQQTVRLSLGLDDVTEARLVVLDLGAQAHVHVDRDMKQLIGFTEFGNAVWGDVLMGDVFENPSTALLGGYGSDPRGNGGVMVRLLLCVYPVSMFLATAVINDLWNRYSCYRHLSRIVKQYYRNRQDDEEMRARRGLTADLAEMARVN